MAFLIRALAVAAAAASAGCLRVPEPILPVVESVAVHAVLDTGGREAVVLVTRFPPGATQAVPVTDAEGEVGRGGVSVALAADAGAPCRFEAGAAVASGCYRASLAEPVAPGDEWWLRVTLAGGETARGEVRVPLAPEIREPAGEEIRLQFSSRDGGTVVDAPLRWVWADAAARLGQRFGPATGFGAGAVLNAHCHAAARIEDAPAGTVPPLGETHARLLVHGAACQAAGGPVAWDSIRVPLLWVATDTAAARYLSAAHAGTGIRPQRASAGLRGAFGVFGATTTVRRTITILPPP
jgi:hypothetical protein